MSMQSGFGGFTQRLFGFRLGQEEDLKKQAEKIPSFTPPPNDDGAMEIAPGGSYGTFVDLEGTAKNEAELVTRYRELALQAEVEAALDDIINEAIIREDGKPPLTINLDNVDLLDDKLKERVREEFKTVLKLLDFENYAYDIFRRWYIDGRLYYHKMIDETKPRDGIKELRYIDPRRIRKVREPIRAQQVAPNQPRIPAYNEYFLYMHAGVTGTTTMNMGVRISKDSIAYVHSGLMDQRNRMVLSALHKAIKPMNQLRMLEDAVVIYRLSRAPERRVFKIDVGNLPKMKAEQYLRDMMVKHKNKLIYDAATGEVRDDRKFMTMLEDFWLPIREGGRGSDITTLQGGQNLGQMEDVEYFKKKVYKSLEVPISRMQEDSSFNFGRANEITRDEVKFSKKIDRIRTRFNQLFDNILSTQLVLRGVMSLEEWKQIKEQIQYEYLRDNFYAEVKDQEVINTRLGMVAAIDPFVGKYVSKEYVQSKILHMNEDEMNKENQQIEQEQAEGAVIPESPGGMPQQDPNAVQGGMPPQQTPAPAAPAPKSKKPKPKPQHEAMIREREDYSTLTEEERELISKMTKLVDRSFDNIDDEL